MKEIRYNFYIDDKIRELTELATTGHDINAQLTLGVAYKNGLGM